MNERQELKNWIDRAPEEALWPLLVYSQQCVDKKASGDFVTSFLYGVPQSARMGNVFKKWDIIKGVKNDPRTQKLW